MWSERSISDSLAKFREVYRADIFAVRHFSGLIDQSVKRRASGSTHGSVSTIYILFISFPLAGIHGALTFMNTLR